jgi:pseudo-rSAM protein
MTLDSYKCNLKETISNLEKSPHSFFELLGQGKSEKRQEVSNNDYLYWLYFHPYTYINVKKNWAVVYNTLNGSVLEYNKNCDVLRILKKMSSKKNFYVVGLKKTDITQSVKKFIRSVRDSFTGDIVEVKKSKRKPFQFIPILHLDESRSEMTFSSKLKLLEGDEISDYLNVVSLYINSYCSQNCPFCDTAYKQFICCHSSKSTSKKINIKTIESLLEELDKTATYKLNVLGGNIFEHSELWNLVDLLNSSPFEIAYYTHYLNLWKSNYSKWLEHIGQSMKNSIHILINFPINRKVYYKLLGSLRNHNLKTFLHFIIQTEKDMDSIPGKGDYLGENNVSLNPLFDGKNLEFFKKNIFLTKTALKESRPSMRDIFSRTTINTLDFGKLTIMCNKKIYSNLNNRIIGKLSKIPITEVIKNEMIKGNSWCRIKKFVQPCKSCPFNAICPPISGYEYIIGRYNTCNIWKNSKPGTK